MQKAYNRVNWENYPSENTPLNESNLNHIDAALNEIDDRVITHETTKANTTDVLTMLADVSFDESTGIFTFTRKNGATFTLDTKLEKLAVNWTYNSVNQNLILTLEDGTKQEVDLSALISHTEFADTDTVAFSVDSTGKVSAIVKEGSIEEKHLQPNYLADVKIEVQKAEISAGAAATSATESADSAEEAKNYAIAAAESAEKAESVTGVQVTGVKGNAETEYRKGDVNITPEDIGLGLVPNVATNDQTPTFSMASSLAVLVSGEKISTTFGKIAKAISFLISHLNATATASVLGHVKLSDVYASKVSNGAAANGLGASQNALNAAYEALLEMNSNLDVNVRYVANETDENYDWIQIKSADGWVNWKKAGFGEVVLYQAGENYANFKSYAGNSQGHSYSNTDANYSDLTITLGENIEAVFSGTNGTRVTSVMSDAVEISGRSKLKFDYTISTSHSSATIRHISVFLTKTLEEKMTAVAETILLSTTGTGSSGTAELDVGTLEGEYYIGINLITQNDLTVSIGNMVMM